MKTILLIVLTFFSQHILASRINLIDQKPVLKKKKVMLKIVKEGQDIKAISNLNEDLIPAKKLDMIDKLNMKFHRSENQLDKKELEAVSMIGPVDGQIVYEKAVKFVWSGDPLLLTDYKFVLESNEGQKIFEGNAMKSKVINGLKAGEYRWKLAQQQLGQTEITFSWQYFKVEDKDRYRKVVLKPKYLQK